MARREPTTCHKVAKAQKKEKKIEVISHLGVPACVPKNFGRQVREFVVTFFDWPSRNRQNASNFSFEFSRFSL
jgi:hypothetical protein